MFPHSPVCEVWQFSTNPHIPRMRRKLPNLPTIASVYQNRGVEKIIFYSHFWFFLPWSTMKFFSLTFCSNFFPWLPYIYSDSQKILGQKPTEIFFTVAPYVEVTSILKSPWDSVTQRVWVYPEKFNIDFLPKFFSWLSHTYSDKNPIWNFSGWHPTWRSLLKWDSWKETKIDICYF